MRQHHTFTTLTSIAWNMVGTGMFRKSSLTSDGVAKHATSSKMPLVSAPTMKSAGQRGPKSATMLGPEWPPVEA